MAINLPREDDIADWQPRVRVARRETALGDGYVRVAKEGINNWRRSYTVNWVTLPRDEAMTDIVNVLKATDGVEIINWTPLNDEAGTWLMSADSLSYPNEGPLNTNVSVTLEEYY